MKFLKQKALFFERIDHPQKEQPWYDKVLLLNYFPFGP